MSCQVFPDVQRLLILCDLLFFKCSHIDTCGLQRWLRQLSVRQCPCCLWWSGVPPLLWRICLSRIRLPLSWKTSTARQTWHISLEQCKVGCMVKKGNCSMLFVIELSSKIFELKNSGFFVVHSLTMISHHIQLSSKMAEMILISLSKQRLMRMRFKQAISTIE
jgi:hypothetical protein